MPLGPATSRQATGWVTLRRPTCSVTTDAVGGCDGGALGDVLGDGDGLGDGICDAVPNGDGVEFRLGIGVLLQAATAISAVRTIRLRRMTAFNRDERSPTRRSAA